MPPNKTLCSRDMSFQDCELAILRNAVENSEKLRGEKMAQSEEIKQIISIVEDFIRKKKLVCYGGTAINNILPKYDQFYDKNVEIPDYDFFSHEALKHAKELADIYNKAGYTEIEAKAGMHHGTYKVFVNFIPVADITQLHPVLFKSLSKSCIKIDGIRYSPPNYLRMAMYLELSRPHGDTSRWEKVLKRINLLNKHYPVVVKNECDDVEFQRKMSHNKEKSDIIFNIVRDIFIREGCVFFGGYAASLYSKYMPKSSKYKMNNIPDFDVLHENAESVAQMAKEELEDNNIKNVKIYFHPKMGEIIPEHYELVVDGDTLGFIYTPISCHAYNSIQVDNKKINVASIDTLLSFYLAFLYSEKPYFDPERILCMSNFLFEVQQKNRLKQSGLLKRFSLKCYGQQETLDTIRAEKTKMYAKLKKGSKEYDEWFLKYNPAGNVKPKKSKSKSKSITLKSRTYTVQSKSKTHSSIPANKTRKKRSGRTSFLYG
jgi:hypothetical protein